MTLPVTIVENASLPWVNGMDVYASMEPAFRDNLGDPDLVADLFSRYCMKQLWVDPVTSRRIDRVRTDPGYIDLCEAYHDSVEEAFFLQGQVDLSAEGTFVAGDYFWRPPGWVHMAESPLGFDSILMMEGVEATEGSDRVSRVVRPDEEAGSNPRPHPNGGLGPRGYVRRAETRFMVWREHDDTTTGLVDGGEPLRSKLLSVNEDTGARSVLVGLPAGRTAGLRVVDRERFLINVSGTLEVQGKSLDGGSLVRIGPGEEPPAVTAHDDVQLLVKAGAPQ